MIRSGSTDHGRGMLALAVVLAGIVFCYPLVLGVPLLDPDEGLHASIAQEMVERGQWVTPRLLGQPFLDKPILYFWAQALSLRLFGMHEAAVRLPGLACGFLGVLSTAWIAWELFSREGRNLALLAAMFYATTVLPTALAQAAAHDVALVPCVNIALVLLWKLMQASNRRAVAGYIIGAGLALGLATLTKGLAGVALVAVAYGSYLIIARRLTVAACWCGAAVLSIAVAVAAPWYIAMEISNPGYLDYYFIHRHLLGFAADSQIHGAEPWWYYLPVVLGGGLPWISYLPVTIYDAWLRRSGGREQGTGVAGRQSEEANKTPLCNLQFAICNLQLSAPSSALCSLPPVYSPGAKYLPRSALHLLWCWLIGGLVLVSLAHSKMATYLWPVMPAVAILAAVGWLRLLEGTLTAGARRLLGSIFLGSSLTAPAVLAIVLCVVQRQVLVQFSGLTWTVTILAGVAAWLPGLLWISGRVRATLMLSILCVAAQFLVLVTFVLPPVAAAVSGRDLAQHFNRLGGVPSRVLIAESRLGSLVFYLDRNLRARLQDGQFQQVQINRLPHCDAEALVILPERRLRRAEQSVDLNGVAYQSVGHYRLYRAADVVSRRSTAADFQRCSQNSKHRGNGPTLTSAVATR